LFSLGVKNIFLGPKPPQFVDKGVFSFLSEQFNLQLTTSIEKDFGFNQTKKVA
jgi:hydroxylamine reductase